MSKDPKSQTKGQIQENAEVDSSAEEGFSLEDLDGLILNKDPDFLKSLKELSSQGTEGDLGIELLDLDKILLDEEAKSFRGRLKKLQKNLKNRFIIFYTGIASTITHFVRSGLPYAIAKAREQIKITSDNLAEKKRNFTYLDAKVKLTLFGIILLCLLTGVYIWKAATQNLISEKDDLFIHSVSEYAEFAYQYEPETESELFYDSIRATQNIMQLKKIVVNVKKSASSGPNPMAVFEFYIEGNTPEVVIEIKDREYEIRDLFQRDIEDMTFDQVDNPEGKKMMTDKLKRDANRILTKGRIKEIFIYTSLVKP